MSPRLTAMTALALAAATLCATPSLAQRHDRDNNPPGPRGGARRQLGKPAWLARRSRRFA